ncbi:MAG: alpha/beta hydrolase [Chloroflexota bacterium]|nr:alpha/beta hydrolase [Chloroflexota bacterium]
MMDVVMVLIHSPLVGPATWSPVADELRRRGVGVAVPELADADRPPFWEQHVAAVVQRAEAIPAGVPLVLAGHSGAGPLLPVVGRRVGRPVAAHVFVDASVPVDGASRLDLMAAEDPAFAAEFRRHLEAGGRFPDWGEEDLRGAVPNPRIRRRLAEELRPRALTFFQEPIPVPAGWPDAPCGYLKFSAAYASPAGRARRVGWAYRELDGGHFHMLVDPPAVTEALLDLVEHLAGHPATEGAPPPPA